MGRAGTGSRGAAGAAQAGPLLLLLMLARPPPAAGDNGDRDVRLVSEQYSQTPQKLSFYSWYGSVRLFRFQVPPDTVLLRWLLRVDAGRGSPCAHLETTVYFRYGAPPVINPLDTSFAPNTSVHPPFLLKMLQANSSIHIHHPAPGDWFLAAHLPPSSQKIEVQGFTSTCVYVFQPDMLVTRLVEVSVLEPDVPLQQTIFTSPSYLKVFVPKYTRELHLELQGCVSNSSQDCPVRLLVGFTSLPRNLQKMLTCADVVGACHLRLPSPPWNQWLQVTAQNMAEARLQVVFSVVVTFSSACRPWMLNTTPAPWNCLNHSCPHPAAILSSLASHALDRSSAPPRSPFCFVSLPVIREDMDVLSVRFRLVDRAWVPIWADLPSVLRLHLNTGMDSGGSLTITLQANQSVIPNNTSVLGCLNAAAPFLSFNTSFTCTTAFFQGYPLSLSASSRKADLVIPFPETDSWYLSLQLVCPQSPGECEQALVPVETTLSVVPCLNDCRPYGQCLLLRRHGYLYAGCSCKAGWRGWSCTDNSTAQTAAQQRVATLLLTLSNLVFLVPIAVSLRRAFLVEASAYAYTMFFSTPGEAVLCILSYDTLQYCDFLSSGVSIWVTILCMARLKPALKYVLILLGTLVLAMSLHLDRLGAWNMMGPCLFAIAVMVTMWVYRCGRRRHCYPPSWQRWVFYLLPGISLATVGLSIYTFLMTDDNYYYTHSIWHILLAGSVVFLLPPREQHTEPWACWQRLPCHYQICQNRREELYTVT
ncbi:post-GPI attachment to proteins factor 6 isoform X2 [Erinaceus europaeus]|uniref:Post-GPI attachment to proteins factor 6 isoform X2 n=1 Tax=Erinaceus europaeus TaxID=9365 RepID=A0ABM3VWE3_ERIEU|nr:post-GPI attachment to proteins factor 6 isoform X2 [Erinaceus europaeus]